MRRRRRRARSNPADPVDLTIGFLFGGMIGGLVVGTVVYLAVKPSTPALPGA